MCAYVLKFNVYIYIQSIFVVMYKIYITCTCTIFYCIIFTTGVPGCTYPAVFGTHKLVSLPATWQSLEHKSIQPFSGVPHTCTWHVPVPVVHSCLKALQLYLYLPVYSCCCTSISVYTQVFFSMYVQMILLFFCSFVLLFFCSFVKWCSWLILLYLFSHSTRLATWTIQWIIPSQ